MSLDKTSFIMRLSHRSTLICFSDDLMASRSMIKAKSAFVSSQKSLSNCPRNFTVARRRRLRRRCWLSSQRWSDLGIEGIWGSRLNDKSRPCQRKVAAAAAAGATSSCYPIVSRHLPKHDQTTEQSAVLHPLFPPKSYACHGFHHFFSFSQSLAIIMDGRFRSKSKVRTRKCFWPLVSSS